ncbi:hypothetical protein WJX73_006337 [Symbiochloris irregularis]|uniref:Exonuclease domain-containing protein n=1 Tax=Symbiochloris irregularis TaxID=706552 RepID=A0AAW1PHN2_9CHLO
MDVEFAHFKIVRPKSGNVSEVLFAADVCVIKSTGDIFRKFIRPPQSQEWQQYTKDTWCGGIPWENIVNAETLQEVRAHLKHELQGKLLLGWGQFHDFKLLQFTQDMSNGHLDLQCVPLFQPQAPGWGLKHAVKHFLGRDIQTGGRPHSAREDTEAIMDLYHMYLEHLDEKQRVKAARRRSQREAQLRVALQGKLLLGWGFANDVSSLRISKDMSDGQVDLQDLPYFARRGPATQPWGLKEVTKKHLGRAIQTGSKIHSAKEDATAVLDLYKGAITPSAVDSRAGVLHLGFMPSRAQPNAASNPARIDQPRLMQTIAQSTAGAALGEGQQGLMMGRSLLNAPDGSTVMSHPMQGRLASHAISAPASMTYPWQRLCPPNAASQSVGTHQPRLMQGGHLPHAANGVSMNQSGPMMGRAPPRAANVPVSSDFPGFVQGFLFPNAAAGLNHPGPILGRPPRNAANGAAGVGQPDVSQGRLPPFDNTASVDQPGLGLGAPPPNTANGSAAMAHPGLAQGRVASNGPAQRAGVVSDSTHSSDASAGSAFN